LFRNVTDFKEIGDERDGEIIGVKSSKINENIQMGEWI